MSCIPVQQNIMCPQGMQTAFFSLFLHFMHLSSISMSKIRLSSSWQLEKLQLFFPFVTKEHNGSWCLQCLCFLHISREGQAASLLLIFDFFPRLQPCFAFDWSTRYVADLLQRIELDFLYLVDVNLGVFDILIFSTYFTPCFFKTNSHKGNHFACSYYGLSRSFQ